MEQFRIFLAQEFDKMVLLQLIQTASLLIHNLKRVEFKEKLLESMFYREILRHSFDFSDDEIIENFMSLLKGLAVNLDNFVLKNFLVTDQFSLFIAAIIFANHREWLIKTASKTVILKILSRKSYLVNFPEVDEFIINSGYFTNLINKFKTSVD